ncbi:MAG: hypothetical protein HQ500_05700 [Flavobacteriales bacterium]|nr:hypothetical protein [Flavobacteriales bacterium]
MKNLTYFLISLSLLIGLGSMTFAQRDLSVEAMREYADSVLGPPDLLVQGRIYPGTNRSAEGHPFLFSESFTDATIFIKDLRYQDIPVLFDLEKDQLVMRYPIRGVYRYIMLSETVIDSVHAFDRHFISSQLTPLSNPAHLPEVIYRGYYVLLRQYEKRFIGTYSDFTPHGRFSKLESRLFLVRDNEVLTLRRKKDLLALSADPKATKRAMRQMGFHLRHANNEQLRAAMKWIEHAK